MTKHRIYAMRFASVYPLYVAKAEKKGREKAEVDEVIRWLTGYSQKALDMELKQQTSFEAFFAHAPRLNPSRALITGTICGVRIEDIEDPLMREIRYLDKLIDELAKGKAMEKILRTAGEPSAAAARPSPPAKAGPKKTGPATVKELDQAVLAPEFDRLSKPAKRAFIGAGIIDVHTLARWSRKDVAALHGVGPSAFPLLEATLAAKKLNFKD